MQNESRSREGIGVRELFRRTLAHRGQWALLLALGYLLFCFPWSWEGFRAFPVYLPIAAALLLGFLSAAVWEAAADLITTPEDVRRIRAPKSSSSPG